MRRRGLLIVCLFMAGSFAACGVDKKNQEVPVDTVETGDGFSCDPGKEPGKIWKKSPGSAWRGSGQEPEQDRDKRPASRQRCWNVVTANHVQAMMTAMKALSAYLWPLKTNTACVLVKSTRIVCLATSAFRPQAFSRLVFQTLTTAYHAPLMRHVTKACVATLAPASVGNVASSVIDASMTATVPATCGALKRLVVRLVFALKNARSRSVLTPLILRAAPVSTIFRCASQTTSIVAVAQMVPFRCLMELAALSVLTAAIVMTVFVI